VGTGIAQFEDIVAWQKARILVRRVYRFADCEPCAKDFRYCGQIQAAAVSVMSNIAEGFERGGNREFRQFLYVAGASCAEVQSLLYVALDLAYISKSEFEELNALAKEVSRIIKALRASLRI